MSDMFVAVARKDGCVVNLLPYCADDPSDLDKVMFDAANKMALAVSGAVASFCGGGYDVISRGFIVSFRAEMLEYISPEPDFDDSMDGDAQSALASAGFGTDEDYGG